jgi:hypothetical protein
MTRAILEPTVHVMHSINPMIIRVFDDTNRRRVKREGGASPTRFQSKGRVPRRRSK